MTTQEKPTPINLEAQAASYVSIRGTSDPTRIGYWVDVPLPAYEGMRVLYRTNNQTRRQRDRPTYQEPLELVAMRYKLNELDKKLRLEPSLEVDQERTDLLTAIVDAAEAYADGHHHRQCEWLASFVLGFDGWPFESIPQPNPDDPSSYAVLYEQLEDLYFWITEKGYREALIASTGNSSATSNARTPR